MVKINAQIIQEIREETKAAMKAIAEKHGLIVSPQKNISYTESDFSIKFTFEGFNDTDEKNKAEFSKLCLLYGLKPEHYGAEFLDKNGNRCVITSINKRAKKYPIMYMCNGRPMKASSQFVVHYLKEAGKF